MKITKQIFKVQNCNSFSRDHFHNDIPFLSPSWGVYIGNLKIATIVEYSSGKFELDVTNRTYKTQEGALNGLVKVMNQETYPV
jgi:hypothetical protein